MMYLDINDLNKNIEKEHESIAGFKYNTQKTQVATGLYLAEMIQKTDALVELKTKIGVTLDGLIVQYEEQSRTFDFMCQGIQTIFTRTGCEKKIIAQSLGDHTTINANNVLDHLALVERQANRLIGHYVKSQVSHIYIFGKRFRMYYRSKRPIQICLPKLVCRLKQAGRVLMTGLLMTL